MQHRRHASLGLPARDQLVERAVIAALDGGQHKPLAIDQQAVGLFMHHHGGIRRWAVVFGLRPLKRASGFGHIVRRALSAFLDHQQPKFWTCFGFRTLAPRLAGPRCTCATGQAPRPVHGAMVVRDRITASGQA